MKSKFAAMIYLVVSVAAGSALADEIIDKGKAQFAKCMACHAVGPAAKTKLGPVLNDLYGRTAGTVEGFKYSEDMVQKGATGLIWTDATLTAYLANPKAVVPKTKMAYGGLKKPEELAALLAYLHTFSPAP